MAISVHDYAFYLVTLGPMAGDCEICYQNPLTGLSCIITTAKSWEDMKAVHFPSPRNQHTIMKNFQGGFWKADYILDFLNHDKRITGCQILSKTEYCLDTLIEWITELFKNNILSLNIITWISFKFYSASDNVQQPKNIATSVGTKDDKKVRNQRTTFYKISPQLTKFWNENSILSPTLPEVCLYTASIKNTLISYSQWVS